jgi:hypothetical protein
MSKKIKIDPKEERPAKVKAGYDEKSPLTGNYKVLVEKVDFETDDPNIPKNDTYKICMETGYQTYWNAWKVENEDMLLHIEKQMPSKIASHKFVDSNGHVWYPMVTFSYFAALHPHIDAQNQLYWAVSDVKPVTDDSEMETHQIIKLPVETNKGMSLGLFKILNTPTKVWSMYEFDQALDFYEQIVQNWIDETKAKNTQTNEQT